MVLTKEHAVDFYENAINTPTQWKKRPWEKGPLDDLPYLKQQVEHLCQQYDREKECTTQATHWEASWKWCMDRSSAEAMLHCLNIEKQLFPTLALLHAINHPAENK